jgi:glycerol kinase
MKQYVMAIDQGTASTRALIFIHSGEVVGAKQAEHEQHYPKPGWVEHDPLESWSSTQFVEQSVLKNKT